MYKKIMNNMFQKVLKIPVKEQGLQLMTKLRDDYQQDRYYNIYQMKSQKQKQKQHKDKILNQIPIFLAQTYRIVDNPQYAHTIQWIPEENGFIVKNITNLTENIFPKHFKHTKYASFVRQLNLYGFHKVRSSQDGHIFTHSYFQKNNPDLLPLIKRKNAPTNQVGQLQRSSSELVPCNPPPTLAMMPASDSINKNDLQLQKQLGALTQKHESLQNLVSILVEQNKQIIMQNKSFINKINSIDDSYRKKLETLIFLMVFGLKNGDSNIIVPQQLNNMIKAFTSGKKQKKANTNGNTNNNYQAVQLFKKPSQDEGKLHNKKLQQIFQMLKMESEGDNSDMDDLKSQNQNRTPPQLNLYNTNSQQKKSVSLDEYQGQLYMPPSPIASLQSISSRYMNDNRLTDDWNDFLDKLQHSDIELDHQKE